MCDIFLNVNYSEKCRADSRAKLSREVSRNAAVPNADWVYCILHRLSVLHPPQTECTASSHPRVWTPELHLPSSNFPRTGDRIWNAPYWETPCTKSSQQVHTGAPSEHHSVSAPQLTCIMHIKAFRAQTNNKTDIYTQQELDKVDRFFMKSLRLSSKRRDELTFLLFL